MARLSKLNPVRLERSDNKNLQREQTIWLDVAY